MGATTGLLARSDRDLRLLLLVGGFRRPFLAGAVAGMQKSRQTFCLVGLEQMNPGRWRRHEHEGCSQADQHGKGRKLAPGGASDEQEHVGDRHVDQPRSEIRLGDDEHCRHQGGDHQAHSGVATAQLPGAIDQES